MGPLALLVLAAIGTAAAFFPSWDSYTLVAAATGTSQTITEGNAFTSHYPGLVVAGDVAVMVAIVVIAALAALWRTPRRGALLLAGAIVPLAAQAVSALIQVSQPVSPSLFGISSAQATGRGAVHLRRGHAYLLGVLCLRDFPARIVCMALHRAWSSGNAGILRLRLAARGYRHVCRDRRGA